MVHPIFHKLARKFPELYVTLQQADVRIEPAQFLRNSLISALGAAIAASISLFFFLSSFNKPLWLILFLGPLIYALAFFNLISLPRVKVIKLKKEIDKDIIFAGKFLIIEIGSGVPIYQALKNVSVDYDCIGTYFKKIVDDIDIGTGVEEAITKAIIINPSESFQKVMWQIVNSIQTGADITLSMSAVLEQISRKQLIEVERYGKKLNPLAMFYLMIAVIFPSLGMVMVVVMVSFVDLKLTLSTLLGIAAGITFMQYMFYSVITSVRPAVDL
jgi:pilus assembly protein TadC